MNPGSRLFDEMESLPPKNNETSGRGRFYLKEAILAVTETSLGRQVLVDKPW